MSKTIIKLQSYTSTFPKVPCRVKVAIKPPTGGPADHYGSAITTEVWEDAIYDSGFVSQTGKNGWYLANNFLFHRMKRSPLTPKELEVILG